MTDKPPYFDEAMAAITAYVDKDCVAAHMDVVGKKEKLVELLKEKSKVYDRVKDIYGMYNMPIDWMRRLPVSILKEPYNPSEGNEGTTINYFDLRSKLRQEHEESTKELEKIESEISVNRLELLLAEIDCLERKL